MAEYEYTNPNTKRIVEQMFPHGERRLAQLHRIDPTFSRLLEDVVYGGLYARDVLDQKTRELCALSALVILGRAPQIRVHIIAALRAGATREEIQEVILQMTTYGGFPALLGGIEVMEQVWKELDAQAADASDDDDTI
jgi:4-carboxymuconolactone decarboxylase